MKTLTQSEIDLLVSVLDRAVKYSQSSAILGLLNAIYIPENHARNLQAVEDTKQALEIGKRLKPIEATVAKP